MANKLPVYLKGDVKNADTFVKNLKQIYNDESIKHTEKNETLVAGHKLSYQEAPSSPAPSYVPARDTRYDFPYPQAEAPQAPGHSEGGGGGGETEQGGRARGGRGGRAQEGGSPPGSPPPSGSPQQ
jgi:hypothetical protein